MELQDVQDIVSILKMFENRPEQYEAEYLDEDDVPRRGLVWDYTPYYYIYDRTGLNLERWLPLLARPFRESLKKSTVLIHMGGDDPGLHICTVKMPWKTQHNLQVAFGRFWARQMGDMAQEAKERMETLAIKEHFTSSGVERWTLQDPTRPRHATWGDVIWTPQRLILFGTGIVAPVIFDVGGWKGSSRSLDYWLELATDPEALFGKLDYICKKAAKYKEDDAFSFHNAQAVLERLGMLIEAKEAPKCGSGSS